MKKLLLATLTGTLLLGACGNTSGSEEKKQETTTKEKSNKKEDKQYNKELRNYMSMDLGSYEIIMNYIYSNQDGEAEVQDMINAYRQYSNELEENLKLHQKNIKNLEGKENEKKINDSFVGINKTFSEFLRSLASEMEKYQSESITEDEFNKNLEDIQSRMENKIDEYSSISEDISDAEFKKIVGSELFKEYDRVFNKYNKEDVADETESSLEEDEDTESSDSFNVADDLKEVKKEDITYTQQVGSINVNFKEMKTYKVKVTEDNEYEFENYNVGDTAYLLGIELELENTSETPQEYFIDQATIVTNNQEQIEPSMITPNKIIKTDLKGKVKSSGMIYYELETSTADDLEWLDFILPEMYDDESMDVTFEEKKLRLEF
ncbi:hypothetical protein MXM59_04110 [Mammaliicoccus sciuri]|uniref:hypothetical protein n=1 Tax=Mammaliicoccus sciuri TaxID=1296 RepID=UPI002DBA77DD|nr:hypothetical protein [Mammaliicoccus sciuri]MEB6226396.1 hypothetical protein [Mammaliicoccus sciuri]